MAEENENVEELRAEVRRMKEQMNTMSRSVEEMTEVGKLLGEFMRGHAERPSKEERPATNHEDSDQPAKDTSQPKVIPHIDLSEGPSYKPDSGTTSNIEKTHTDHETKELLESMAARLRAVEENKPSWVKNTMDMCLVPGLIVPVDFKVPDFEKYRGISCPKEHLTMYARRMTNFAGDDKMMIHFFQDSLAGAASSWYMRLEKSQIRTYQDLSEAFIDQYKFNMDIAPDRTQLQNLSRKNSESFREYALRWRALAAQVDPPLTKREMNSMFLDTLPNSYYEKMVGLMTAEFADMITVGEKIDGGLKFGKLIGGDREGTSGTKRPGFIKKKEGETNAVMTTYHQNSYIPQMAQTQNNPHQAQTQNSLHRAQTQSNPHQAQTQTQIHNNSSQTQAQFQNGSVKPRRHFDQIPMSYPEIYAYLLAQGALTPIPGKVSAIRPRWYDETKHCEFHMGIEGHDLNSCISLKHKVQDLIDQGSLSFKTVTPNVNENPLLPHHNVNVVGEGSEDILTQLEGVKTPIRVIFNGMIQAGLIESTRGLESHDSKGDSCIFHLSDEHSIEDCSEAKMLIQKLIDYGFIQISKQIGVGNIGMIEDSTPLPKAKVIPIFKPLRGEPCFQKFEASWIPAPAPFPYSDSKSVPWKYAKTTQSGENVSEVTNITGVGGVTRSGRVYLPQKDISGHSQTTVPVGTEKDHGKSTDKDPISPGPEKQKVSAEEASEFLRFIKHSEYQVVDQLSKTPAKISILSLLTSSESHRNALMKVLNEAHVPHTISTDKFERIVGNIIADNYLTFTDDEIPLEGTGHIKPLHISVMCKGHSIGRVLIDNGSALNVMPLVTLKKLPVDISHMRPSIMIVKAFDGGRRGVVGEIDIPMKIGPCTFEITFQVMDFIPSYSCLLGRPWIHMSGAVPSTLHQKLKFVVEGKMVSLSGEEDILVSHSADAPYVDVAEEAVEIAFQTLEIANTSYVGEGSVIPNPRLSEASMMVARVMMIEGYQPGKGLGKNNQGVVDLIIPKGNKERFGLGYKPTSADWLRVLEEKKKKRFARHGSDEYLVGSIPMVPISKIFLSAGFAFEGQVNVVSEDHPDDSSGEFWVHPRPPGFELNNWEVIEFPKIVLSPVPMSPASM